MNEQLISFKTAKLAKEKGFKLGSGWQIRSLFNIKDGETFCEKTIETPEYACERCTQSLLQKWIREKHDIHIIVNTTTEMYWTFGLVNLGNENIFSLNGHTVYYKYDYNIYEEALEKGLQEALKLI